MQEDVHEGLDGFSEFFTGLRGQRIEGIAQAALTNQLECCAAHPPKDVQILGTILHLSLDGGPKLLRFVRETER